MKTDFPVLNISNYTNFFSNSHIEAALKPIHCCFFVGGGQPMHCCFFLWGGGYLHYTTQTNNTHNS